MYTEYWQLARRPFDNDDEPRFYYPGETHQASLLKLHYTIANRRGAGLLAGASGLGKTLLVRSLLDDLSEQCQPQIHLRFPQMRPESLVAYLASHLTGETNGKTSLDANLQRIEAMLAQNVQEGRHALVVIDEAHLLCGSDTMETVRLLLNYQPAWTVLLVGQPALLPALHRMPELEERLAVKCLLRRFSTDETVAYVSHRLRAAGAADVHAIFEPEALEVIHQMADGVPRKINRLADLALLIGFADEQPRIGAVHVEAVAEELMTADTMASQAA
ncbi:MAG: AAA family ATPase [Planctomycetes bacterium]|nr:AAA family ATPase [Planctomycetota bacterium]